MTSTPSFEEINPDGHVHMDFTEMMFNLLLIGFVIFTVWSLYAKDPQNIEEDVTRAPNPYFPEDITLYNAFPVLTQKGWKLMINDELKETCNLVFPINSKIEQMKIIVYGDVIDFHLFVYNQDKRYRTVLDKKNKTMGNGHTHIHTYIIDEQSQFYEGLDNDSPSLLLQFLPYTTTAMLKWKGSMTLMELYINSKRFGFCS